MDGWEIRVYVGGEQTGEERIGTITLPDIELVSVDEEQDQYYTWIAQFPSKQSNPYVT